MGKRRCSVSKIVELSWSGNVCDDKILSPKSILSVRKKECVIPGVASKSKFPLINLYLSRMVVAYLSYQEDDGRSLGTVWISITWRRSLYLSTAVFAHTIIFRSSDHKGTIFPSVGHWSVDGMSHKAALVLSRSHKYHGLAAEALDKSFLGRQFQHVVKFQPRRCKLLWQTQYN